MSDRQGPESLRRGGYLAASLDMGHAALLHDIDHTRPQALLLCCRPRAWHAIGHAAVLQDIGHARPQALLLCCRPRAWHAIRPCCCAAGHRPCRAIGHVAVLQDLAHVAVLQDLAHVAVLQDIGHVAVLQDIGHVRSQVMLLCCRTAPMSWATGHAALQ